MINRKKSSRESKSQQIQINRTFNQNIKKNKYDLKKNKVLKNKINRKKKKFLWWKKRNK